MRATLRQRPGRTRITICEAPLALGGRGRKHVTVEASLAPPNRPSGAGRRPRSAKLQARTFYRPGLVERPLKAGPVFPPT